MLRWQVKSPDKLLPFVKKNFNENSGKDIRWAIEHNRCSVNGFIERFCSRPLKNGDIVTFCPDQRPHFAYDPTRVLYEDDKIVAYDKPPFFDSESIATYLKFSLIHRLDRDTTGVLLLAKSPLAQEVFQDLFRQRSIAKEYLAIIEGSLEKDFVVIDEDICKSHPREGTVLSRIVKKGTGLSSKTEVRLLKKTKGASLLLCKPITGRTHQIRIHLKSINRPLLGDYEYGKKEAKENLFRPMLHAKEVKFVHPDNGVEVKIEAPLPQDFRIWKQQFGL